MSSSRCKICVSLTGADNPTILKAAMAVEDLADVLEIRLDDMAEPDVSQFLKTLKTPLLFTNRAGWEGGGFAGDEAARLKPLYEAVDGGAGYIDIELNTDENLRRDIIKTARGKCKTIVSWHNFTVTPSRRALESILRAQYRSAADIGKIVTLAHGFDDVLRVLNLQREAAEIGFPLIAFCMGRAGAISRVATMKLGGFMTYAAPDREHNTAPGQLAVAALKNIVMELKNGH
ncbi:MAG: type I 3-dehydroquinate dehydratase [Deltaproteobacteria bacterium]|nr:type I 3-dehydroquinate dehydratase [Deltaproteobacteria bacterium]